MRWSWHSKSIDTEAPHASGHASEKPRRGVPAGGHGARWCIDSSGLSDASRPLALTKFRRPSSKRKHERIAHEQRRPARDRAAEPVGRQRRAARSVPVREPVYGPAPPAAVSQVPYRVRPPRTRRAPPPPIASRAAHKMSTISDGHLRRSGPMSTSIVPYLGRYRYNCVFFCAQYTQCIDAAPPDSPGRGTREERTLHWSGPAHVRLRCEECRLQRPAWAKPRRDAAAASAFGDA